MYIFVHIIRSGTGFLIVATMVAITRIERKDHTVKKIALALCVALMVLAVGCSQANGQGEAGTSGDSTSASAQSSATQSAAASSDASGATCDVPLSEMPEFDFGMDEGAYFAEAYNLKDSENLDLISRDQLVWIAQNKGRAAVLISDASDKKSAEMIAEAQKAATQTKNIVYVYEPVRDAPDGAFDALAKSVAQDGVANLESLEPGTLITMSRLTVDSKGNPAPVNIVVTEKADVFSTVDDTYGLTCCG